ncbi:unnamed protein product [Prunus armeniaca]
MVVVREPERAGEGPVDITPKEYAVRTMAQGSESGGAFRVSADTDTLVFSNYSDQRLYKQSLTSSTIGDSSPTPLTPDYGGPIVSYADEVFDARFNRYITLREGITTDPITTIVAVELDNTDIREPEVLVGGSDFYAFPRLDRKGERFAWIEWSHPDMPWDKAQLWVGYISEIGESPTEPKWSSKGELFFITDRQNAYWNLYKWIFFDEVESNNEVISVYSWDAEFSGPLWNFGMNSYELIQSHEQNILIACSYRQNGRSYLGNLDDVQSSFSVLNIPFTDTDNIVTLDDHKSKAVAFKIIWSSSPDFLKYKSYFSLPKVIRFPTEVPGQTAFAYFYTPSNPDYQATQEEKPPLLLQAHGGPTFESCGILNLSIQYWTSRGGAFVAVNYGGSSGYDREYRERLLRKWGIVDVNDCCSCARYLVDSGKVDGKRLCITGDSAGSYTTLAALAFRDTFKAGASLYGIADLTMLRAETQKFESHYIDCEKGYFERSPINFIDRISCPIILFQGLEDKSVPPVQARTIYHALKDKGLPVALVEYEGGTTWFLQSIFNVTLYAENIKFTLEQQMVFFARLVGHFKVADDITPIKVDNFN